MNKIVSRLRDFLLIFLLFTFLSGCLPQHDIPDGQEPLEKNGVPFTETIESKPPELSKTEKKESVQPSPTPEPEIATHSNPKYTLDVVFDYPQQKADIRQSILYRNNSSSHLSTILLACDTLRYPGSFSLNSMKIDHQEKPSYSIGHHFITIKLDDDIPPGREVLFELNYSLSIPPLPPPADDRKPGIFGFSALQTNFVDWYPFIPPLSAEGNWILNDPWFFGEYLVYDLSDFVVTIQVKNGLENMSIAASTLPIEKNDKQWNYFVQNTRNFAWSVGPSYLLESTKTGDIQIDTYSFPFHKNAGSHVLTESAKAIELFSEIFSEYPRRNLTIVEADFFDGMEYDGLFFLSRGFYNLYDNTPANYLTAIAVHETAHQWWYSAIANNQALEPWLDEALCTYSELLFYEAYYPELVDWWWAYRIDFYQPEGKIDQPIYDYQGFVPYRNAVYLQGAKFIHAIRNELGDESFFKFIKNFAQSENNKITTSDNFFKILSEYTDIDSLDLDHFFAKRNQ